MTGAMTEFQYVQELVFERSAIVLSDDKHYLIESRLLPLARGLGLQNISDIIDKARRTRDRPLEDKIVEAMTTNETLWLRDIHPFMALRRVILPELIARQPPTRQLAIWSAASSSGQEIYSLAMILEDEFPQLHRRRVALLGTDLNTEMIDKARNGLYSKLEMNRGLPAAMLIRHFSQEGTGFRISETIRSRVEFMQMNLAGIWPILPKFDVIMLRNVLIYFDRPTKQRILSAAANQLAPGGYLFLGSSETMMGICDLFISDTAEGATFYRLKEHS